MSDITRYPFLRHLRGNATTHVQHLRNGRTIHAGVGRSFWFRPLSAVLSEVPVEDRELPLVFHARTSDFQDVAVQATVTYRLEDPAGVAQRIDFSIDPTTGLWRSTPLEQVAAMLTEAAQQYALDLVAGGTLPEVLGGGITAVREAVADGLRSDDRLADISLRVIAVRVVAIRPEPEVERALQTPTREQLQQESDRATFERRARAVERERAIGENELQTRIELARREEQLVSQRGANARREAEEQAEAGRITTEAEAARRTRLGAADAERTRLTGLAEAEAERARISAYDGVGDGVLVGLALKELAAGLPHVDSLVLTPELLSPVLARLARTGSEGAEGRES